MADNVQRALRRKYAAAQAIGDLERMKVLRGFMAPDEAPVEAPVEAPEVEAPAVETPVEVIEESTELPEVVEPSQWWKRVKVLDNHAETDE